MIERLTAWQCIGCGRIEAAQQCIGVCRDRRVELVEASDYDAVVAQLERVQEQIGALAAIVRQIAATTPREGQCERTWLAIQAQARKALQMPRDNSLTSA